MGLTKYFIYVIITEQTVPILKRGATNESNE